MTRPATPGAPVLDAMRRTGIVPLFGSGDPGEVWRAAEAVAAAGLSTLEVTLRAAGAFRALERTAARVDAEGLPIVVGAGTVLDAAAADAAIDAGARFVFSPTVSEGVVERCLDHGVPVFPGCATPTEIHASLRLGCEAVKLFPATTIGGPDFLRAVRPVFPELRTIPTGGIVPEPGILRRWFEAGALAVGLGSWLFPSGPNGADWELAGSRLRAAAASAAEARKEGPA